MSGLVTLHRSTSPPPTSRSPQAAQVLAPAAVEAGQARLSNSVAYFHHHLETVSRPTISAFPRLDPIEWRRLWHLNQDPYGRMFVVHQHDHPVAGVHYDLRLQFSPTSAISFSIPYGLPGNPNSLKPNRMAIETRVHCLWNHLVESASLATGSLLIWDTGNYEVLPYKPMDKRPETDEDDSDYDSNNNGKDVENDSEKLFESFQNRHIRLRLHGTKLPKGYTISFRLPSANNHQARKPKRKRRRTTPSTQKAAIPDTDSDDAPTTSLRTAPNSAAADSDNEEDKTIRSTNAYPGSTNTIGSIHQRQWFLTLDKPNSGFVKATSGPDKGRWIAKSQIGVADTYTGWPPFFVRGRDVERSVVTGRLAKQVMEDEGVEGYMGRKMWRPILE